MRSGRRLTRACLASAFASFFLGMGWRPRVTHLASAVRFDDVVVRVVPDWREHVLIPGVSLVSHACVDGEWRANHRAIR